jgi:AcrR family transcriptional regulator
VSDLDDTATRLVLAAEGLFAGGGEESTSLRAITRAARSNAAAVHYHFGGRDELLRAVLERHLAPLEAQRFAQLDAAVAEHGRPVPVGELIAAVVTPDLELLERLRADRVGVAQLLGRAATLPGSAVAGLLGRQFDALAARVLPLLRESVPGVDPAELRARLRLVQATVAYAFAAAGNSDGGAEQARRLIAFGAGGLSAPGTAKAKKRKKH